MAIGKKLREIAATQCGYFNATQAVEAGYAHYLLTYHTKAGNWKKIDRALYRLPGYDDSPESRLVRWGLWAQLRSPNACIAISHESALWFYHLCDDEPSMLHLTFSALRSREVPTQCCLHVAPLSRKECVQKYGYSVTTPFRTLQDIKPDLVFNCRWESTVQKAHLLGLITPNEYHTLIGAPREEAAQGINQQHLNLIGRETGMNHSTMHTRGGLFQRQQKMLSPVRSFTLVEMLVVIAIIAILAALLMPSLRGALESSRTVSCQSNLRQAGMMLQTYASDYNGFLPQTNPTEASYNKRIWYQQVIIYAYPGADPNNVVTRKNYQKNTILICPSDQYPIVYDFAWSYAGNQTMAGIDGLPVPKLTSCRNLAQKWYAYDSWSPQMPGNSSYISNLLLFTSTDSYWIQSRLDRSATGILSSHNNKFNMLFLDAHAAAIPSAPELEISVAAGAFGPVNLAVSSWSSR